MRLISVAHTQDAVRARSKDVTRRLGWITLEPGTLLQPVAQAQGLKKGERVQAVGLPVYVVRTRRERLAKLLEEPYGSEEASREGFPGWTGAQFVDHYCRTFKVRPADVVTRIEWKYTELPPFGLPAPLEGVRPLPFEAAHE